MNMVFVTRYIPENWLLPLKGVVEYKVSEENLPLSRSELMKELKWAVGAITMLSDKIDKEVMDNTPNLKIIANYAVGYDNIDIDYATKKGILITNTPDVLTNATAELALSLMFSVGRRIVESDRFTRGGRFEGWYPTLFLGKEFKGKTVGIIGAGRIGLAFAQKCSALGMNIAYYSRQIKQDMEMLNADFLSLDEVLKKSDIVSIHLPLTEETHHLLNGEKLSLMKEDAILINTGRGPIVDERALTDILKENKIYGAGLDVYEYEPGITRELLSLRNVVLAPHIGSATYETRKNMAMLAAENIANFFRGKKPPTPVNPEVLNE